MKREVISGIRTCQDLSGPVHRYAARWGERAQCEFSWTTSTARCVRTDSWINRGVGAVKNSHRTSQAELLSPSLSLSLKVGDMSYEPLYVCHFTCASPTLLSRVHRPLSQKTMIEVLSEICEGRLRGSSSGETIRCLLNTVVRISSLKTLHQGHELLDGVYL